MDKNQIFSYLTGQMQTYTLGEMALNLLITFMLMMLIYVVYAVTHKGNGTFSTDFGFTIVLTGLVTAVIMMVIESNLALSLGMVGALSIIRFRTAVKNPKDTGFIFWSVATGLCAGTGGHVLALFSCAAIGCFVTIYSVITKEFPGNMLVIRGENGLSYSDVKKVLDENKIKYSLKMRESTRHSQQIIFKVSGKNTDIITDQLMALEYIQSACLAWEGEE